MSWPAFKTLWLPPRSHQQEWLDTDDMPTQDLQRNLDDLRWLNRYLGSHWLLCTALQRVWRKLRLSETSARVRCRDWGWGHSQQS